LSNSPVNRVNTFVPPPRAVRISQCNTLAVEKHSQAEKKSVHHIQKNEPLHHKHTEDCYQYAKKVFIIHPLFSVFISFFLLPPQSSVSQQCEASLTISTLQYSSTTSLLMHCSQLLLTDSCFSVRSHSWNGNQSLLPLLPSDSLPLKLNCEDKIRLMSSQIHVA